MRNRPAAPDELEAIGYRVTNPLTAYDYFERMYRLVARGELSLADRLLEAMLRHGFELPRSEVGNLFAHQVALLARRALSIPPANLLGLRRALAQIDDRMHRFERWLQVVGPSGASESSRRMLELHSAKLWELREKAGV